MWCLLLLAESLVRIMRLAMSSRPELKAALIRTPFAKLLGPLKRWFSMIGCRTAP
jgi:hypothetical protein